ncbi:MAG: hypothetical protein ACEPO8_10855 [Rhodothermaceae bacterium]
MQREICCTKNILSKLLILMIFCIGITLSQNNIPRKKLLQDFNYLVNTIESTHPTPYHGFGGRMFFHLKANECREKIPPAGMTRKEFYFIVSEFVVNVNDKQTFIYSPFRRLQWMREILPVELKIVSDGLIIKKSLPEYYSLIGAEIKSVNGVTVDELLKRMRQVQPCENISGVWYLLKKHLTDLDLCKQLFPSVKGKLTIEAALPDSTNKEVIMCYEREFEQYRFIDINKKKNSKRNIIPFTYKFLDDKNTAACLKFTSTWARETMEEMKNIGGNCSFLFLQAYKIFQLDVKREEYEKNMINIPSLTRLFYDMLVEMKKNNSKHLIIDLRESDKGFGFTTFPTLYLLFGDKYLNYNNKKVFCEFISENYLRKSSSKTIEKFNEKNKTSCKVGDYKFYNRLLNKLSEIKNPEERIKQYIKNSSHFSEIKILEKQNGKPVYSPKIIVVTSPATFDGAFQYLGLLKNIGDIKIVGVASRQAYNLGFGRFDFELKNSRLLFSVSKSYDLYKTKNPRSGDIIQPDFPFTKELFKKYKFDEDAEILYIKDLIKKNKL